jgi:Fic family protein
MQSRSRISRYLTPQGWINYRVLDVANQLVRARTASGILNQLPYLPSWIEQALEEQLRLEAAGTTRIEGAVFSSEEEEDALSADIETVDGMTHSQRQLRAADGAYRWINSLPADLPINAELILGIHRRIVTGCDDDHCEPGALRRTGVEADFGTPLCRGAESGSELATAFTSLVSAIEHEYRRHDRVVQAIAAHYHLGAMHPFGDGNGRTARAVEAYMLRAAGVNEMVMVSLSDYYYEHQERYLAALYESRRRGHDLTPFLEFALGAVDAGCRRLADRILIHNRRILCSEFAQSLFGRLRSPRRRALGQRQLQIIRALLESDSLGWGEFSDRVREHYNGLKYPLRAIARDLDDLWAVGAIRVSKESISMDLDWPRNFSESELLSRYENLPSVSPNTNPIPVDLTQLLGRPQ